MHTEEKKLKPEVKLFSYIYSNGGAIEYIPNTKIKNTILVLKYKKGWKKIKVTYWLLPDSTSNISVMDKLLANITIKSLNCFEHGEVEFEVEPYRKLFASDFDDELFAARGSESAFVGQGVLTWYGILKNKKSTFGRGELLPEKLDSVMRPLLNDLLWRVWKAHQPG